jgi:hypothetical protein
MLDETTVEETTTSSSDEIKSADVATTNDSEVEKTQTEAEGEEQSKSVPYNRFKEVNEKMKLYKEMLDTKSYQATPTVEAKAQKLADQTDMNYDQAEAVVRKIVREEVQSVRRESDSKIELQQVMAENQDFGQYKEQIKAKIKENPSLSWSDAYRLARYDDLASITEQKAKGEAYQKIDQKRKAVAEGATKSTTPQRVAGVEAIDPLAKGPDGKFLYTRKELEEILPKQ